MGIIAWIIVGLVAGVIARALAPGRDPMGIFGTIVLGLAGSVPGGLVGTLLDAGDQDFTPAGIIGSILGAIVVLIAYRAYARREA